jgi:hypothetical protein
VIETSVLTYFRFDLKIYLECDSSDYVFERILSQKNEKDQLIRLVAYFFKTLSSAECNYEIYDKKLLTIIRCFEEWRVELQSINKLVKVLTNHKILEYFMIIKKLNKRQTRWVELLANFDFEITYQAEKIHEKANVLTRRSNDRLENETDERNKYMYQTLFSANRLNDKLKKNLMNDLKKDETSL